MPATRMPPFYLVWNEEGFPPRYRHLSYDAAEREARRLADENPGKDFVVLQPVLKRRTEAQIVEHYADNPHDAIPF